MNDTQLLYMLRHAPAVIAPDDGSEFPIRFFYRTKRITIARQTFARLAEAGWVTIREGRLHLTASGLAELKKSRHADACAIAGEAVQEEGSPRKPLRNTAESPLARLYNRPAGSGGTWLDHDAYQAGEKLRCDFEQAGMQPHVTSSWSPVMRQGKGGGSAKDISDFALDARRRVEQALAILDPSMRGAVLDICCFLKGLEQVERERQWPPRSAKLLLRSALTLLARHYGIGAGTAATGTGIRHWGEDDFRPTIF